MQTENLTNDPAIGIFKNFLSKPSTTVNSGRGSVGGLIGAITGTRVGGLIGTGGATIGVGTSAVLDGAGATTGAVVGTSAGTLTGIIGATTGAGAGALTGASAGDLQIPRLGKIRQRMKRNKRASVPCGAKQSNKGNKTWRRATILAVRCRSIKRVRV
jgi:hypothetical protein